MHHGDMSCHFNMLIKKARKKTGKQDFDVDKCTAIELRIGGKGIEIHSFNRIKGY